MPIVTQVIISNVQVQRFNCIPVKPPLPTTPPILAPPFPNPPQEKHMNDECCKLVKEIHKYLGIEKLKRNKFPVSNAFLAPGGSGDEQCFDQYEINQALFRMLANGLIINPQSSPQGQPYKNSNATAWAGQVYEMVAEGMSDGNLSQKYEISMAVQVTQMWAKIAEIDTKLDTIIDALGYTPNVIPIEIPCCFNIFDESKNKGFGVKSDKKQTSSDSKERSDEQVESIINRMIQPSTLPILKYEFNPESVSVAQALRG